MKILYSIHKNNDLISTLKDFGFSYNLSHYLYHHPENILVNNKPIENFNLKMGDELTINLIEDNKIYGESSSPLDIIYEDEYILIVFKKKNQATIPTFNHYLDNLASDVSHYYLQHNIQGKIHCVTRLDYETSGLVLFAKHQYIHNLFQNTLIDKYYLVTVHGIIKENGIIKFPIKKDPHDTKKRIICSDGKKSITEYKVLKYDQDNTTLLVHLLTGRTHQIRLHFSSINHPVIGDSLYGHDKDIDLKLECYNLIFTHPITKNLLNIKKKTKL